MIYLVIMGLMLVVVAAVYTISMCRITKKMVPPVGYQTRQKRKPFLGKIQKHIPKSTTTTTIQERWDKPLVARRERHR